MSLPEDIESVDCPSGQNREYRVQEQLRIKPTSSNHESAEIINLCLWIYPHVVSHPQTALSHGQHRITFTSGQQCIHKAPWSMAKSDTHIASLHLIGTLITCWCSTTTTLLLICLDNCNSLLIYLSRFNTAQLKHSLNTWSSMIIHDQALMFSRVHVNGTPMGAHQAASSNRLTFPIVNLSAASLPRIFACFDGLGVTPAAVSVWRKLGCFLIFGIFDIEKTIHEKNPWTRCFFEVHETNARNCLPYMAWRCIFHVVSLGNPSFYRKQLKKTWRTKQVAWFTTVDPWKLVTTAVL